MTKPVVLITGASRGIGAATAVQLAKLHSATVYINYREKAKRATTIASEVTAEGGYGITAQADITDESSVANMLDHVAQTSGKLDALVLNASGGMERDMPSDYAMRLNRDAQVQLVQMCLPLLADGGKIVFVTSHQAHFGLASVAAYSPVAASKRAGEDALLDMMPEMHKRGITLTIVTGDIIEGTATAMLLDRANPGLIEHRRAEVGAIPTIPEFASAIVAAVHDPSHGNVVVIGSNAGVRT